MPVISWLIKKNADAPVLLADARVTSCITSHKSNGVDALTFTQQDDWLAAPTWPWSTVVALIRRSVDGEETTDRCVFVGTVETIPRQAVGGGSQAITYTAYGPAYELQLCDYSQNWHYTDADDTDASSYQPTVVLGQSSAGVRITSGGVVSEVVAYAASRGVNICAGTIASGITLPLDQRDNIKCWDAIVAQLRYTPDYVVSFDYDHTVDGVYVPALNFTAPASMSTVTKALVDATAEGAVFTPRYDLRVPGILITYRYTDTLDARTVKRRIFSTAGSYTDHRRVSIIYDLEGLQLTTQSQEVEVESYPAWDADAGKDFVAARIPWLSQLADGDWSIVSVNRDGDHEYSSQLLNGSVPEWTGCYTERETFTVKVNYVKKSTDTGHTLDQVTEDLTFTATSTNAMSTTYRRISAYTAPEAAPSGLATALYLSWNRLHYDGSVTFHEQECAFDILPGMLLSCTGGLTEWATMQTLVQDVTCDIATGTTAVRCGTCGRLEADTLMALFRGLHGRRHSYNASDRENPDAPDGSEIDGATETPNDTVADGTPPCLRKRFAVEAPDADANTHLVDINPGAVVFATVGNKAAQNITLREMVIPYLDGSTVKAKLAQVLCSAGYGDDVTVSSDGKVKGTSADSTPGFLDAKVEMSVTVDATSKKLRLSGDVASPGNYYAYCTNGSGTKGWLLGVTVAL